MINNYINIIVKINATFLFDARYSLELSRNSYAAEKILLGTWTFYRI